jgi:hypothetical protein
MQVMVDMRMAGLVPGTTEYNALIASCLNNVPTLHQKAFEVFKGMQKVKKIIAQTHTHRHTKYRRYVRY